MSKSALISAINRIATSIPSLVTAAIFLWVWIDPSDWRRELVTQGLLIMLLEFVLIHSNGFMTAFVYSGKLAKSKRISTLLGLGVFYMLFVGVWAWQFKSWMPVLLFIWLLGSKVSGVILNRFSPAMVEQQMKLWGLSLIFYLLSVFATLLLPLPLLGLTHHGSYYGMPGSGEWIAHPYKVISAVAIYFALLGITSPFVTKKEIKNLVELLPRYGNLLNLTLVCFG